MYSKYNFKVVSHSNRTLTFNNGKTFKKSDFCIRFKGEPHHKDIPQAVVDEIVLELNRSQYRKTPYKKTEKKNVTELARLEREKIIAERTRKTASAPPQPNTEAERQTFVDPMNVYGYRSATTYSQPRCADTSGNSWRPFKYALPDLRSSVLPPISESVFKPEQMTLDASPNLFSQDGQVSQEPIVRTDLPAQSQEL